jgi:hypothetical protein
MSLAVFQCNHRTFSLWECWEEQGSGKHPLSQFLSLDNNAGFKASGRFLIHQFSETGATERKCVVKDHTEGF